MNLDRIYAIFIRQWFLLRGSPIRFFTVFIWSIISIFEWGFISRYVGSLGIQTFNYVSAILGALVLWEFSSRVQQSILTGFLEDIWSQNFINIFASPLKIREYLTGLILNSVVTGIVNFTLIALLAGIFFGYNILSLSLMLLPFMLVLFVFGMAMGIMSSVIVFRFGSTAEWLAWPIASVIGVVSAVFYPVAALPAGLQLVAKLTPASYVFESLRALVYHGATFSQVSGNLLLALLLSVVYLLLIGWLFAAVYRRNLDRGEITRFNSESF
ncbi:MAG: ABC transporter permease [Candidatus Falkowbacteria bacterium]